MSQTIFSSINPNTTSGNQLATILTDFKEAMVSGLSGDTRPTELDPGGNWIDTSVANTYIFKIWTGSIDVEVFRIDTSLGTASVPGAADSFSITKISADTASPILDFIKKRIINDGQVLINDYIGTIRFGGDANDGSTPVSCRIRAVATNNFTSTTSGADLVFELTPAGSAAISEIMRIKDGSLGLGTSSPSSKLHVTGDAIRMEKASDDAVGSRFIYRKKRISSLGQVTSGDVVGESLFNSTDDAGAEISPVAKIEVSAGETHTSAAHGSKISFYNKKIGSTTLLEQLSISGQVDVKTLLALNQQVDSSTTGSNQSITPTKSLYKVTNASLGSLNNIASPSDGRIILLVNGVGASVTIKNDTGGTATNRIITGTGVDLSLADGASLLLAYDSNSTRWRIIGGSGSGGGSVLQGTRQTGTSISAGTQISPTANQESLVFVVGNGGAVIVTNGTPVATSGMTIGQKCRIVGTDDTNTVQLDAGNNLVLMRGSAILGKDQSLDIQYMGTDGTNAAWVETGRNI